MSRSDKSADENLLWFHGKISREKAEEILRSENRNGIFLVRESNTSSGDYVLSVFFQEKICHYQIRRHGEDAFFSIKDVKFHGLETLIEFYRKSADELETQLNEFVKGQPPPNDSRSHGRTNLLHRATKENNKTIVSELLKCGYRNFDAKNQNGQTALHVACINSSEEILKLLINVGANVNCRDTEGNTPLHYACRTKSVSFIKTLINAKANIHIRNITTGYVPLHDAAKSGNLEIVKLLLELDAAHLARTSSGEFPLDLAIEAGHHDVINLLKNYIPKPPNTNKDHWYHGTLSRDEAVLLLNEFAEECRKRPKENNCSDSNDKNDPSGLFLIRFSNRTGYVLTLLADNEVRNFKIQQYFSHTHHFYIDEGPYLPSLEHLVQHYSTYSDGLPVNLRLPVPPKPKPPLPQFSTMPKASSKRYLGHKTSIGNLSADTPYIPQAITSPHPGDDAMNRVGLFEGGVSPPPPINYSEGNFQTNSVGSIEKKLKDKRDMTIFRSFKPRSQKKNYLVDGVRSLRKAKLKSPNKHEQRKLSHDEKMLQGSSCLDKDDPELSIKRIEPLMKNLCFSTDFINKSACESFYNIPKKSCSIVDIDIGENDINKSNFPKIDRINANIQEDSKPEEIEENYYTKSDKMIEMERNEGISRNDQYFIDAPPPINMKTYPQTTINNSNLKCDPSNNTSPADYVPTVDVRQFIDGLSRFNSSPKNLDESSAELRELSKHPERLDSIISNASTASEITHFLNRQNNSNQLANPEVKSKSNYFIPSECLVLKEIIGEGEFGSVYRGYLVQQGSGKNVESGLSSIRYEVAIKTLHDDCRMNKQEFLREASVMIRLQHHCIVNLIGISKSSSSLMMVQELVSLGSMLQYIIQNTNKINPNYELKLWASQIACGMHYLESQHFVHRDLAARNILLSSRNQAKISDFGLSRAIGTGNDCYQASQGGKWPIKWYAPESFNHGYFSHASDVWSFGVTLWEMYSMGEPPYGDMRGVDAIKLIEEGKRLSQPALCPDNVYKIMEHCWNYKPKDRPTFRYLTEFFASDPDYQNILELVKSEHIS
ncbi:tyrosine-protein kinase Shark [Condylostylus longicornis]|uniref:tyrosine-protein kinase Shark n=1 Tax=Condylostylus longicornis TaxID=2530218 RepID=UPI00244E50E4|nr:tyrosine-protein kinase Shark [Condylostylus longicornis]XP_055373141.1 tyrosine-protein kinase Shark [Condylostylus longicornis]